MKNDQFFNNIKYDPSGAIVQKAKPLFRVQCTSLVSRKPFNYLNVLICLCSQTEIGDSVRKSTNLLLTRTLNGE